MSITILTLFLMNYLIAHQKRALPRYAEKARFQAVNQWLFFYDQLFIPAVTILVGKLEDINAAIQLAQLKFC